MKKVKMGSLKPIGTTTARIGAGEWPVEIYRADTNTYKVIGGGATMRLCVIDTDYGFMVAVPTHGFNRAGFVPDNCEAWDIEEQLDIEDPVDAETIAAAVRWLIEEGEVIC